MHIPPDYYEVTEMEAVMKNIKASNKYIECTFTTTWAIENKKLYLLEINVIILNEDASISDYNIIKELFESDKAQATWVKDHIIFIVCKDEVKPIKLHITINNGLVVNEEKRTYRKIRKKI